MQLIKRMKALRKSKGMTQRHLAKLFGVSDTTICQWEKNRDKPSKKHKRMVEEFVQANEMFVRASESLDFVHIPEEKPETEVSNLIRRSMKLVLIKKCKLVGETEDSYVFSE